MPNAALAVAATAHWRVAASLAAWSRHPLSAGAGCGRRAAAALGLDAGRGSWPGQGLRGRDAHGMAWRLGAREWAGAVGCLGGNRRRSRADAATQVWLCAEDGGCACFSFDEALRDGAAEAMARAARAGLPAEPAVRRQPGARAAPGAAAAVCMPPSGGATPQDKLAEVAAAQARGERVAMVGDGVNDAPVLARADVSLAMGQGALVARAQADAVLVGNRPMDIVQTLRVARRTMRIVRQNLVWALLYNAGMRSAGVARLSAALGRRAGHGREFAGGGAQCAACRALSAAEDRAMEILYLLIPLSAALVLLILGVFAWALHRGQFDDLEREGERILHDDASRR